MNILLVIFGFFSGIMGGMGMGGGTLLIPLLSFLDIPQQTIQAINLISFLPMAVVALLFHFKNGLVKTKNTGWLIVSAAVFAVVGAFLSNLVEEKFLKYGFGIFLLGLGIWQTAKSIMAIVKERKVNKVIKNQRKSLIKGE